MLYVGSFFGLAANFFDFWTHLKLSCIRVTIFCNFSLILGGFGRVFGRILGRFLKIFGVFLKNADFVKNGVFPKENCYF